MTIKKVLLIVGIVIVIAVGITGALYQQKLTTAALTNVKLEEKLSQSKTNTAAIQKKFNQLGEISTLRILSLQTQIIEKDRVSQAIVVKTAKQIRDLRFLAGTWEDKYNRLEPECLQLSVKIAAQDETIGLLKLSISELENRDVIRIAYIKELTGKLTECQSLLEISIKNTKSILRKPILLRIFSRLSIVAGGFIGSDGKPRFGIGGGLRII